MYKEFSKQIPKVTPTFQSVLIKEIGDAMDAINDENVERAYRILRTLIDALKEEHSKPLLENDVEHIENLLAKAREPKSGSFYRQLIQTSANQQAVLLENIRLLFRKIMRLLHKHGYLEKTREIPVGRET